MKVPDGFDVIMSIEAEVVIDPLVDVAAKSATYIQASARPTAHTVVGGQSFCARMRAANMTIDAVMQTRSWMISPLLSFLTYLTGHGHVCLHMRMSHTQFLIPSDS